ncbi:hypothetical protein WA026_014441 [Henosepilachna vigintioctopunctata]|uniref:Ig-like domain-containing protein n=1 Tax=Henosepilachna vigintioctopunctata TaxID=420089 RepID=A0AAW1UIP7_9CUCU
MSQNVRKQFHLIAVPPDIINDDTSGDLSVSEGENATLWCKATGHPEPRIAWRKEDGQPILIRRPGKEVFRVETYNGSSLFFWKLDRKQMGAYLCIASNDVPPAVSKRIALNVNFAPLIKVPNQLLGAPLNTDVQLECYVEAFPNTINYWIKNRGEMLINGSKYTIREERSGYKVFMWLVIRSFSPSDIGTYNCVSTNSLGRVEGTLRLYGKLFLWSATLRDFRKLTTKWSVGKPRDYISCLVLHREKYGNIFEFILNRYL